MLSCIGGVGAVRRGGRKPACPELVEGSVAEGPQIPRRPLLPATYNLSPCHRIPRRACFNSWLITEPMIYLKAMKIRSIQPPYYCRVEKCNMLKKKCLACFLLAELSRRNASRPAIAPAAFL
jgi:hypothetical protein